MPATPMRPLVLLATLTGVVACDTESGDLPTGPITPFTHRASAAPRLAWSEPVNLGAPINTAFREISARLAPDGRSIYFVSNRPGGIGTNNDIWVAQRASRHHPWQTPFNLGLIVNSAADDGGPSLSADGLMLFFNSNRPGGQGQADLYVSRRADQEDDLGWGPPANLGPLVNTTGGERGPEFVVGRGGATATLYFNAGNLALQQSDLYAAPVTLTGEPLGPAQPVSGVNDPNANDAGQSVRPGGRVMHFWSERAGGFGDADLWVSVLRRGQDVWSTPENLGAPVNTEFAEERPHLSRDGRTLFFDSTRPDGIGGSQDIWASSRIRIDDRLRTRGHPR